MSVLLVRPDPGNERFGLGPFFRAEPLGLEYVGAALRARGTDVTVIDARFGRGLGRWVRRVRPRLVGISCLHSLEFDSVLAAAREVKRLSPETFVLVGGHASAAYPFPVQDPAVDALCMDDGEEVVPELVQALERGRPTSKVEGLRIPSGDGTWVSTPPRSRRTSLDAVPLPARDLVERYRQRYQCLLFRPIWVIETARGCPYRCSFCAVGSLHGRSFRERSIGAVADDFVSSGPSVFVVDDLFWHHPARSLSLARELARRGVRKRSILVQSRTDLVARHPELLEAWRPLAQDFDIFFGLEAATDEGLDGVTKDLSVKETLAAVEVSRSMRYGVTGNFLVDPAWDRHDFAELWDFVAAHGLQRAGYTILTPLPGTELHRRLAPLLEGQPWFKYDMNHLLWEPNLGARGFFELYAETWRRSILNTSGEKSLLDWLRQVRLSYVPTLTRILMRTQRMMRAEEYLREHEAGVKVKPIRELPRVLRAS